MDDQTDYSYYYYIHVHFRSVSMTVAVMREQREPEFLMLVCCSALLCMQDGQEKTTGHQTGNAETH